MKLIICSGLPGTGKTTVAEIIGRKLSIPVFAKDWVEATLLRCGLLPESEKSLSSGYIAYELLTILTQRQFQLGQSAILDCVTSTNTLRKRWCQLADDYHAVTYIIECICSDKCVHRVRLGQRERGIPGWHELDWSEVERVNSYYEPWYEKRLILDMVNSLEKNIELALAYLSNPV